MRIHFIGCNGVSMRELMQLERDRLNTVTGSDAALEGHDPKNVHGADLVVYTCAVGEDNVELSEAKRLGIPTIERAELLGQLAATYSSVIAIAGAHGKTTATGMTAAAMHSVFPTVHIGGELNPFGSARCRQGSGCFITEACEYRRSFLKLKPDIGAVLNVDLDHTDYYRDFGDIHSAYSEFAARCGVILVNSDDKGSVYLNNGASKYTFGLNGLAYFRGENIRPEDGNAYSFDFKAGEKKVCRICTPQPGFHNIYNALCAAAIAVLYGLSPEEAARNICSFKGVKRRFERVGHLCGATVVSDYAHHPKEIRATLSNAAKCTSGKVYAVFQPHTYTRTKSLETDFVRALKGADEVALLPVFPARETPIVGVTAHNIVLGLQREGIKAVHVDTFCAALDYLRSRVRKGDMVLFLGAGDIDCLARSCAVD